MSQSYTTKTYLKKQELHLTIMKHTAKYCGVNDFIFSTNYSLTCHHVKEAFKVTKFLGQDPPSERASNVIKKDPNGGNEKVAEYEIE